MIPRAIITLPLLAVAVSAAAQDKAPSVAPPAMQRWAPGLAADTDAKLYADVWRRSDLSPRDRSLVTLTALVATGKTAQLKGHLGRALDNGLTPAEIGASITHLAYYVGWPNAVSALEVVDAVMRERGIEPSRPSAPGPSPHLQVFTPNRDAERGPSDHFTGAAMVTSPFGDAQDVSLGGATVTFAAGAHTKWHRHARGQLLVVTAGEGRVQERGGAVRTIRSGDVVWTPAGIEHWHGATPDHAMTHVAVSQGGVTWLEPVTAETYRAQPARQRRP